MIKSMTGFAAINREDDLAAIGVTIRSVNHRYLDLQIRVPQSLAALEVRVRGQAQQHVARGRVEVVVTLQVKQTPQTDVELNEQLVAAIVEAFERARGRGLIEGGLTAGDLLRFPQALAIRERASENDEAAWSQLSEAVVAAVEEAFRQLDRMRVREGQYLRTDLDGRVMALWTLVDRVATAAAEGRAAFEARLAARVQEMTRDVPLDAAAVAQEVVRMAARSDISEEIVRMRGHLTHWAALADAPEPCGRRLDFLLQEMNREVNTIGSKAEGVALPELIVAAKAELEKLREQAQNVE